MATAALAVIKHWLGGPAPCMEATWEVVAVWAPAPRTIVRWVGYSMQRETITPPGAGKEFKFKVVANDAMEAIEAVQRSGFFQADLAKQFGFVAKEIT